MVLPLLVSSCVFAAVDSSEVASDDPEISLLPWSEQSRIRDQWLEKRHDMLLPMMRRHGIDMWIVVNEEFHDDPLTEYIAPRAPTRGVGMFSCSSIREMPG